ncbi:hypothetical protein ABT215_09955 [Streptomyces sp900105755]|uniref:hypothetical protein n=1 Tax=Streptomyces sp. 900105755 TaxID=3154389 RepID=UPI0033291C24
MAAIAACAAISRALDGELLTRLRGAGRLQERGVLQSSLGSADELRRTGTRVRVRCCVRA